MHVSLPVYSGGLGALAGDLVKEASDRALPLRRRSACCTARGTSASGSTCRGWQREFWLDTDPDRLPAALVTRDDGEPLTVSVPVRDETIVAQIWRVDVGRVPLFLLDAERPENSAFARWTTSQLYVGDPAVRLNQYALLGVGGMRALAALGIEPGRRPPQRGPRRLSAPRGARARRSTRSSPTDGAPDGLHDAHPGAGRQRRLPRRRGGRAAGAAMRRPAGSRSTTVLALGRTHPDDAHEPFGITQLATADAHATNGVSRRHGEVAREMWQDL